MSYSRWLWEGESPEGKEDKSSFENVEPKLMIVRHQGEEEWGFPRPGLFSSNVSYSWIILASVSKGRCNLRKLLIQGAVREVEDRT